MLPVSQLVVVFLVFLGASAQDGASGENDVLVSGEQTEDNIRDVRSLLSNVQNLILNKKGRGGIKPNWTPGEKCDRKCGDAGQTCYFQFNVEDYVVLSPACGNCSSGVKSDCLQPQCVPADGFIKPIQTVNRALPGTPIVVCRNDTIVVDVKNLLADGSVTIHWHGIRQRGTPHMDGVSMVSQCPISPATTFRYSFKAAEAGTFFWHSHIGSQKLDGIEGPLVIRDTNSNELHRTLYDEDLTEHIVFVQDWIHVTSHFWTPGPDDGTTQIPDGVLINGRGPLSVNGSNDFVPMANFTVESGKRYRFRLISATCMTCSFALRIQSHPLTVISADGGLDVKPVTVDSIGINSADRFDFVLHANQTPGDYYIMVETLDEFCRNIKQTAVLHYAGSSTGLKGPAPSSRKNETILNDPNSFCNNTTPNQICVSQLSGDTNAPSVSSGLAQYLQIPFAWGVYLYDKKDLFAPGSYQHYEEPVKGRLASYTVNNISYSSPPSPLSSQFSDIPSDRFCAEECRTQLVEKSCSCTNYYTIPLKSVVDLIVYATESRPDGFNHPFHLHGHNFYVLEQAVFPSDDTSERLRLLEQKTGELKRNNVDLRSAPAKDSLSIPAGGYALLRFYADNPGWWFVHCHFLYHMESGMAAVFKVGNDLQIPRPPRNFPKCGDFYE